MLYLSFYSIGQAQFTSPEERPSSDSLYLIQFIALKDTTHSFEELTEIGKVVMEYLPVRKVARYSIGHFTSQQSADRALKDLILFGYEDAFIRKILGPHLLPSDFISGVSNDKEAETEVDSSADKQNNSELLDYLKELEISSKEEDSQNEIEKTDDSIAGSIPSDANSVKFSLLYTGKSLGVLGNTRFQSEHELATEYAIEKEVLFKLVSHACWRSKGLTIFLPSDEPDGHELDLILQERKNWEVIESYPALKTNNVVMFRDPDRLDFDMLGIVLKNERTKRTFPEMKEINVRLYRTVIEEDKECFIVEEENAIWPAQQHHWAIGEINRLDYGKN